MDQSPVRARHVSKKSLRAKVLKEGVNELHDVFDRMMQRHTVELHMIVEKWCGHHQGEMTRSQSPFSDWGSRSESPVHSRAASAVGRRKDHKLSSMDYHMEPETKAQHTHPYPITSGPAVDQDTLYLGSGLNQTFSGGYDDSHPGIGKQLNSRPELDASSLPGCPNKRNLQSNAAAKDIEVVETVNRPSYTAKDIESSCVPSLPGYVHHPDQPDPNTQPRLRWDISKDHEQDLEFQEFPAEIPEEQKPSEDFAARRAMKLSRLPKSDTRSVFMDVDSIKNQLKRDLTRIPHSTVDFYWKTGWARWLATNTMFENITLFVILSNALWMGYDANSNSSDNLNTAEIQFQIAEHFFCSFFTIEWIVRFSAFQRKINGCFDFWFVFDSLLLFFMIMETWILTALAGGSRMFQGLRWLRLVRLTRLARIARLLRAVPELLIMVKAIVISLKTVSYTFVLLILVGYVFGVAFTILMEGKDSQFDGVFTSMNTLLLAGALPDQAGLVNYLKDEEYLKDDSAEQGQGWMYYILIVLYLMIASLMMMNMLIGMLTEVISGVATLEKEQMMLTKVKEKVLELLTELGHISEVDFVVTKKEFESLLVEPRAALLLQDVGVDVVGLVDFADFIFHEDKPALSFEEFMDVVLQLRGSNAASVKDVVDLRKLISSETKVIQKAMRRFTMTYGSRTSEF